MTQFEHIYYIVNKYVTNIENESDTFAKEDLRLELDSYIQSFNEQLNSRTKKLFYKFYSTSQKAVHKYLDICSSIKGCDIKEMRDVFYNNDINFFTVSSNIENLIEECAILKKVGFEMVDVVEINNRKAFEGLSVFDLDTHKTPLFTSNDKKIPAILFKRCYLKL